MDSGKNIKLLIKIIFGIIVCFLLVRGCLNFMVSVGKESNDPETRAEAQRLEENIKGIGRAFWQGLTGQ